MNCVKSSLSIRLSGRPSPAWGKHFPSNPAGPPSRVPPTGVGQMSHRGLSSAVAAVDPRWRGGLFKHEFPLFWVGYHFSYRSDVSLYQFQKLPWPSDGPAASLHTSLVAQIFSRDFGGSGRTESDVEKGGDGRSISASAVTLIAAFSSPVKPNTGGSGSGCSAFGLPVGSTAAVSWVTSLCFHTAPSRRSGKWRPCPAGELDIEALVWCRK